MPIRLGCDPDRLSDWLKKNVFLLSTGSAAVHLPVVIRFLNFNQYLMYRTFFKPLGLIAVLALVSFFVACQKEDDAASVENFTTNSIEAIHERGGFGKHGCYELVFPVSIQFADSTVVSVNSYDELRQAIRDWYVATGTHPKHGERPTLVFPFQVLNEAGEIITVETPEQLQALKDECRPHHGGGNGGGNGGGHGHGHGQPCYTLVFPVTIQFPDSTQVTVNTAEEYRAAVHTWKENNPGIHGKAELVFPITVQLQDGSQVAVNSKEELRALKEDCRD